MPVLSDRMTVRSLLILYSQTHLLAYILQMGAGGTDVIDVIFSGGKSTTNCTSVKVLLLK